MLKITRIAVITAFMTALSPTAYAKDLFLGAFHDWKAHAYTDEMGRFVCNIFSRPTSKTDKSRESVYLHVTHRPRESRYNEVAIKIGHPLELDSTVELTIDGKNKFAMFSYNDSAYSYRDDDKALVHAMKMGVTLAVKSVRQDGKIITDTFSLRGITSAYGVMSKSCGYKGK